MFARGGTQGGEGFTGDKASEGPYGSPAWYIENVMEELDMVSRTSMHVMFAASALRCAAAMMVAIYMYVCVCPRCYAGATIYMRHPLCHQLRMHASMT